MPSWSDDEGRCQYAVDGGRCYQSPTGCPMHGADAGRPTVTRRVDLRAGSTEPFGCIIADPPWRYENTASNGPAEAHYPTMSTWEIAALPVREVTARSAHLYLWVTDSHLEDVFRLGLLEAWGFRYVQTLKWLKVKDGKPQMGAGNYYRHASELCIFAVKGRAPVKAHNVLDFFWAPRTQHSAKPSIIHEYAEAMSPGPYLELFARSARPGWYAWGNEAPAPAGLPHT